MKTHTLKCWPEFYTEISAGRKTHDLRRNIDRNFEIGDVLTLQEFDPKAETYTDRTLDCKITYITSPDSPCAYSSQALDRGFSILSIKLI